MSDVSGYLGAENQRMMDPIVEFLTPYPSNVSALAARVRKVVRDTLPDASETLDAPGRVIGYGVGPGYSGLVCTIIPSKTGVKLGIARGTELDDPHGLLQGNGKRHRYVQLIAISDVDHPGITELLRAGRTLASPTRS